MKVRDVIDVIKGLTFLLFAAISAFLVTSPIGLGMFLALSHEGVAISSVMGIGVYFVGFIYLIFAYQFVKNVFEIVDGGAKEIGESVFSVLFKVTGLNFLFNMVIGALVYLGCRIFI